MIQVYVAARWETKEEARKLRAQLLLHRFGCTSRWIDEEPALGNIPAGDERRIKIALMDAYDVRRSQALIFHNPAELLKVGGGGCQNEVGKAQAWGIPVFVIGEGGNVFHWEPPTKIFHGPAFLEGRAFESVLHAITEAVIDFDEPKSTSYIETLP